MLKDKKIILALLIAAFSVLTYFHTVAKDVTESHFYDFGHYWIVTACLMEGYNVWAWDKQVQVRDIEIPREYDHCLDKIDIPIHSLPFFVFVIPFSLFSFRPALFCWLFLSHLALFASIWLMLRIAKTKPALIDWLITLFLVFSFWPLKEQLYTGQPNHFILFFLALSVILMQKKQMFWAGISLAIAVQFREYLGIVVLFFLWKKKWKFLVGLSLGYIFLKISGVLIFGWEKEAAYWQHQGWMFLKHAHYSLLNCSPAALIYRIAKDSLGIPICVAIYLMISAIFIGLAFFWTRKKDLDLTLGFCLFLTLSFLVSPWTHEQHFIVLYLPFILGWFKLEEKNNPFLYTLFIAVYLFLGLGYSLERFPQFHSGWLAIFTAGKQAGIIILFFLIAGLLLQGITPERKETQGA